MEVSSWQLQQSQGYTKLLKGPSRVVRKKSSIGAKSVPSDKLPKSSAHLQEARGVAVGREEAGPGCFPVRAAEYLYYFHSQHLRAVLLPKSQ